MDWPTIIEKIVTSNDIFRLTNEETLVLYDSAPLHQFLDNDYTFEGDVTLMEYESQSHNKSLFLVPYCGPKQKQ